MLSPVGAQGAAEEKARRCHIGPRIEVVARALGARAVLPRSSSACDAKRRELGGGRRRGRLTERTAAGSRRAGCARVAWPAKVVAAAGGLGRKVSPPSAPPAKRSRTEAHPRRLQTGAPGSAACRAAGRRCIEQRRGTAPAGDSTIVERAGVRGAPPWSWGRVETPSLRLVRACQMPQPMAATTLHAIFASEEEEGLPPPMLAPSRTALAPGAQTLLAARPGAIFLRYSLAGLGRPRLQDSPCRA